jgi:hypothetical protein
MAKDVSIKFPALKLGKVDLVFEVKEGGKVFGDLKVSKGGIEWRPKFKRTDGPSEVPMNWVKFDRLMRDAKNG